jgi:hypothetical protein
MRSASKAKQVNLPQDHNDFSDLLICLGSFSPPGLSHSGCGPPVSPFSLKILNPIIIEKRILCLRNFGKLMLSKFKISILSESIF